MNASTKENLVAAAARLLDEGGLPAVTLRAVAGKVGVSHNTPYRHFSDRNDLLSEVAERDFSRLAADFSAQHRNDDPRDALLKATNAFIQYARQHPARYQLLYSENVLVPDADLRHAAMMSFDAFRGLVERAQAKDVLPKVDANEMTGLIYATLHGAIELELSGRALETKGLGGTERTIAMLFDLLGQRETVTALP